MSLQYKFFIIPTANTEEAEAELNRFIRSVRVITTHREFVSDGRNSFWGMVVEYLKDSFREESAEAGKKRVDYREVLSPEDFTVFSKLREWRKHAASQEDIPVYAVLSNEQMAKIVENRASTKAALKEIDGIGDARIRKYGEAVIKIIAESFENKGLNSETERQTVPSDSSG